MQRYQWGLPLLAPFKENVLGSNEKVGPAPCTHPGRARLSSAAEGLGTGSESPQCQFSLFLKLGQARKPSYLCPGRSPQMELGGAPNPPAILMVPSLRP